MSKLARKNISRTFVAVLCLVVLAAAASGLQVRPTEQEDPDAGIQASRTNGQVLEDVVHAPAFQPAFIPAASAGFVPQARLGFNKGNQW